MSNIKVFPLRAHHAVCLLNFRGKGYSPQFTQYMRQVFRHFKVWPESLVCVGMKPDSICEHCPHDPQRECTNAVQYDQAVLELCGLQDGQCLPWSKLQSLACHKILDEGILKKICGKCLWYEFCRTLNVEYSVENVERLGENTNCKG